MERLCEDVIYGRFDSSSKCFTREGSFWTGSAAHLGAVKEGARNGGVYKSLAMIPISYGQENLGLLVLKNIQEETFTKEQIEFYERTAGILGVALMQCALPGWLFENGSRK